MHKFMKDEKGFTLVELLIVVVIIGILASIAVVNFADKTDDAENAKIIANLEVIETALDLYYIENGKHAENIDELDIRPGSIDEAYTIEEGKARHDGKSKEAYIEKNKK